MLYDQHQCLTYEAPADQVVFDSNLERAKGLLTDPNYRSDDGKAIRRWPTAFTRLPVNGKWDRPQYSREGSALLFLHELRTPRGTRRLIGLSSNGGYSDGTPQFSFQGFEWTVATLGDWSRPLKDTATHMWLCGVGSEGPREKPKTDLRIYAGQVDPNNPAKFTVRYVHLGKTYFMDWELNDRGNLSRTDRRVEAVASGQK